MLKDLKSKLVALFLFIGISLFAQGQKDFSLAGPKIFQIGFNRCGTATLSQFFQNNNIKSIHWNKGKLARSIQANYLNGLPLIGPEYKDVVSFFDMECVLENIFIGQQLFKELDSQYPGSKFILNTRDKKKWLKSRVSHRNGLYLEDSARVLGLSLSEIFFKWSQEWDQHHANVLDYFKDRPGDLIVFDIEKDSISKLCDFLKFHYQLNPNHYPHLHKSEPLPSKLESLFERLWLELGVK